MEYGVAASFRFYTGVRLALLSTSLFFQVTVSGVNLPDYQSLSLFGVLEAAGLFLYLSSSWLQRRLKGVYLPLGVIWATLGPIIEQHMAVFLYNSFFTAPQLRLLGLQLMPVFFIPLVIVAWQYSMREVIIFTLSIGAVYYTPLLLMVYPAGDLWAALIGSFSIQTVTFLLVGNMIVNMMSAQRAQRSQMKDANQRMAQYAAALEQLTISRERNRMARELHDVLAHTLSGVSIELEGARSVLRTDPQRADGLLNHSLTAVREGLTETRRSLKELRARPLEELGLSLALRSLAESTAARAGLRLELNLAESVTDLSENLQQSLYRIAQEALVNAVEHSQASRVSVLLERKDGLVLLRVSDDGSGFDPKASIDENRYGLRGMQERAQIEGGELTIDSRPGEGTSVTYRVAC